MTLELLHLEYLERHPDGYRYTAFCAHYRRWCERQKPVMRQLHRAGEKAFVDYSGDRPSVTNPQTGEVTPVELFVGVLGASNFTFAEAALTQQLEDWLMSHVRMFESFRGVAAAVVPDQLKSGVSGSCAYEPAVNRSYTDLATHYGTVVLPARPGKPRDKAKVESAVLVAQRWLLARIRDEKFFSLAELNARLKVLLAELNDRPMKALGGVTRRQLFEELDRPALRPLPAERFEPCVWRKAKVNIDYHVAVDRHLYSVPHGLVHAEVEVRLTAAGIEIFHQGQRVAAHCRSHEPGRFTTVPEHMPAAHRQHLDWSPSRLIRWANKVGPQTEALVTRILEERPHPEQGYRSCLGLLRLAKSHGDSRLEAACARALAANARSFRHVKSILDKGLDRVPLASTPAPRPAIQHDNIRGPAYYGDDHA